MEQAGENQGAFSPEKLKSFAASIGLNTEQFNRCLDSGKKRDVVQNEIAQGRNRGVRGTPTFFVNGQLIEGGGDYQVLRSAIETVLRNR